MLYGYDEGWILDYDYAKTKGCNQKTRSSVYRQGKDEYGYSGSWANSGSYSSVKAVHVDKADVYEYMIEFYNTYKYSNIKISTKANN